MSPPLCERGDIITMQMPVTQLLETFFCHKVNPSLIFLALTALVLINYIYHNARY